MKKIIERLIEWFRARRSKIVVREDMGYGERIEPVVSPEDDHTW